MPCSHAATPMRLRPMQSSTSRRFSATGRMRPTSPSYTGKTPVSPPRNASRPAGRQTTTSARACSSSAPSPAEDDKFSGFVYQVTLSTGVGYKFIDSDSTKLTGTVGVGYRRLQSETPHQRPNGDGEVIDRIKGDTTGDAVGTVGIDYLQQLTKTTKLTDKFLVTRATPTPPRRMTSRCRSRSPTGWR